VGLSARLYFGCDLSRVTAGQAALLAALPQSPGRITGGARGRRALERRRKSIVRRMAALGFLTAAERDEALQERVQPARPEHPFRATHAVEMALREAGRHESGVVRTTIDGKLQAVAEKALKSRRKWLEDRDCDQAAVVVLDNESLEVLALVGSQGVRSSVGGWNNGCLAYRSAGSSLKPFAYALALEEGWTPASMLRDTRRTYATPLSDYRPLNFSRTEHGPVSLREALGASLNLPAVNLMRELGPDRLLTRLKQVGLRPLVDDPDHYGLGLVLGNMEVRLLDLAAAYACLANGGVYHPPRVVAGGAGAGRQAFSEQAAYLTMHILSDASARVLAFGRPWYLDFNWPVALKTGTSTSYRDAWLVACTTRHTVAVWAGNFTGESTEELTGASACGPVVHDLLEYLCAAGSPGPFVEPPGIWRERVCSVSGCIPGADCPYVVEELFMADHPPGRECPVHKPQRPDLVFLPSEFASWESKQATQGLLGRYRLQGGLEVPGMLELKMPEPWGMMASAAAGPVVTGHVSIGADHLPVSMFPEGASTIEITSPMSVDRYMVDPGRPANEQVIRLQVEVSRPVESVTWYVDGVRWAQVPAPYESLWQLARGKHRIAAACPDGTADAVTVTVE